MNKKKKSSKLFFTIPFLLLLLVFSIPVQANVPEYVIPFIGTGVSDGGTYEVEITGTITAALAEGKNILNAEQISNILGRGIMIDDQGTIANWNQNRVTGCEITVIDGKVSQIIIYGNAKTANYKLETFTVAVPNSSATNNLFSIAGQSSAGQYDVMIGGLIPEHLQEGTNVFGVADISLMQLWGVMVRNESGDNKILKQDAISYMEVSVADGIVVSIKCEGNTRTANGTNEIFSLEYRMEREEELKTFNEWFSDPVFASCTASILNKKATDSVTLTELASITKFSPSSFESARPITTLDGIEYLPNLEILTINLGAITEIPESIGELKKLRELTLRQNKIEVLPESIGNLENLEILILGNNKISEVPESIGNLRQLTYLYLSNNNLSELPDCIGELTSLEQLYCDYNCLTALPDTIGNLTNLIRLACENNSLTSLPNSIDNLENLSGLLVGSNQIEYLPELTDHMSNLITLRACQNKISELPSTLPNSLVSVDLRSNLLKEIPSVLCNLNELTTLYLADNDISIIPDEIGMLTGLRNLSLGNNSIVLLPDRFEHLINIEYLSMPSNKLTEIPDYFVNFSSLSNLNIQDNPIDSIPAFIFEMGIKYLYY